MVRLVEKHEWRPSDSETLSATFQSYMLIPVDNL